MRLLKLDEDGEPVLASDYHGQFPPYAILSHTWLADDQEVTFDDITTGAGKTKTGFDKIRFCGRQAKQHGLTHFWVDACCIDKRNSVELSEAINSMYRWYANAQRCYVYLADVSDLKRKPEGNAPPAWEDAFRASRWHRRGWTLQELVAPKDVSFFTREGHLIGDKSSLEALLHDVTTIPVDALRGTPLAHFPIDERLRWTANRQTTKVEDKAYCLFGIFNVFLPPIYGEGDHALVRLREAIGKHGNDFDRTLLDANPLALANRDLDIQSAVGTQDRRRDRLTALGFEQMDARRATIRDAQATTCEWILEHPIYVAWVNSSVVTHSHRIMWINGKPGAGKSTLVKYTYAEAQRRRAKDDIILSFFFNARGDDLEKVTEGMYRTLLYQLLTAVPDLQRVLDHITPLAPTSEQHFSWTLASLQSTFADAVSLLGQRSLACFIDALDECEEEQVRDMVDFFEDLVASNGGKANSLQVLFASRHYPTIHIEHGQRLILEDEAGHDEDMAKYIKRHLRAGSGNALREVHRQIQEKANGVFLWAVLVVDILKKELERGRMFALKKRLQDLKNRLQEIPKGLSELFKDILRRDHVNMDDLLLCLQWILFAKRPLKREEFYFAMAAGLDTASQSSADWKPEPWDPEDVTTNDMARFILNSSKGLAELTKAKPYTVQFIHESVRDFLLRDKGLAQLSQDHHLESSGHERLKHCCQSYLAADIRLTIDVDDPAQEPSKEHAQAASTQFPFLAYATHYVLYHADGAARDISQDLFLAEFPFSRWLSISNLLQRAKVRRHSRDATRQYILAEQGLTRLIASPLDEDYVKLSRDRCQDSEERYGHAVIAAFANGHVSTVKALLKRSEILGDEEIMKDPDFGNATKASFLHRDEDIYAWAARTGNIALATLERVSSSRGLTDSIKIALCALALQLDRTSLLEALFAEGIDPDAVIDGKKSPATTLLAHAIHSGDAGGVRLLLDKGANVDKRSESKALTPLMIAAQAGDNTILDILLHRNADVHLTDQPGRTALLLAASEGHDILVRQLLHGGALVDTADHNGQTSLFLAAGRGHMDTVQALIDSRADLEASDYRWQRTPLMVAANNGSVEVMRCLLKAGAKMDALDRHGWTALFYAVAGQPHVTTAALCLVVAGANVRVLDLKGCTVLFYALRLGARTVELIRGKGSALTESVTDESDESSKHEFLPALHRAAKKGIHSTLKRLIASTVDVDSRDLAGFTALMHAVAFFTGDPKDQMKTVHQLIIAHANVNAVQYDLRDAYGRTALDLVASQPPHVISAEVVKLLTQAGARVPGLSKEELVEKGLTHSIQDYQMQLMLLEAVNKKRLLKSRQDNDYRSDATRPPEADDSAGSNYVRQELQLGMEKEDGDLVGTPGTNNFIDLTGEPD